MKVLCIVAVFVALAAAQSGDDGTMMTENPESPQSPAQPSGAPGHTHRPGKVRPTKRPHRGTAGRPRRSDFSSDDTEDSFHPEAKRHGAGRHGGPHGGKRPDSHPFPKDQTKLSPIFKVDNVTFQNSTTVQLKEGENMFIMQEIRPPFKQYLKLTYNTTEPNRVSMEFGELKPPNRVVLPVFKVDNVTFQNTTSVQMKEGDNLFLKVKGRGPHHSHPHHGKASPKHRGPHGLPVGTQYVKVLYNSTEPNQVSVEYGVAVESLTPGAFTGQVYEEDDEDFEDEDV